MTVPPASQLTSDRDAADVETTISVSGNEAAGSSAAGMRATADDSSDEEGEARAMGNEPGPALPPPASRTITDVFDSTYKQTDLLDSFERWRGHSNFKLDQPWEAKYKTDPFWVSIGQEREALLEAAKEQEKERREREAAKDES